LLKLWRARWRLRGVLTATGDMPSPGGCYSQNPWEFPVRAQNVISRRTIRMKQTQVVLLSAALIFAVRVLANGANSAGAPAPQAQPSQTAPNLASTLDRQISEVEKEVTEAAEAMLENKFNFSPESLNIPGDDYKGVRTFAQQVKHIAASNFAIWRPLTGDNFPKD